ncbi:MAG: hypothetical protein JWN70_3254 [Planctomycetaceae bacterium]|nr:hypothetical protein [Planctomycetaceae bacterium]
MSQRRNELAERAVVVLATACVVIGGIGASIFLIVTNSSSPTNTLIYFAIGCIATGMIIWLLREPDPLSPRASIFAWFRRGKTTTYHYKLKVRKPASSVTQQPQQPPTAESIRQISQESLGTWVPSKLPPKRKREDEQRRVATSD